MELEEVLLDSQSRTKLAILSYLMDHPGNKIYYSDIQGEYPHLSRLKFNVLVAEMSVEIQTLFDYSIMPFPHALYLESDQICFNVYMRFLIERGLPYQFILCSLVFPDARIEEFLTEHFVSRSTLTRALKPLKVYSENLDLKLNYSKICFLGDEGRIRYIYLKVLWLGSLGRDIEKTQMDFSKEKKVSEQLNEANFSNVSQKLIVLYLAIARVRTKQGYKLEGIRGCEGLYPEHTDLLETYYHTISDDPVQVDTLINSFKYQFVFAFYYSSDRDSRLPVVKQFSDALNYTDPIFIYFFKDFLAHVQEKLAGTELQKKDIANLFSITYLHYLTQGNMLMFLGFDLDDARQTKQYDVGAFQLIKQDLQNFFKRYLRRKSFQWLKKHLTELAKSLSFLLYPYYQKKMEKKIKVLLMPVLNYLALQHIVLFLDRLDFIEYSTDSKELEHADIILSNFHENIPTTATPVFIFEMNNQENNLINLFQLLWRTYERKNTPQKRAPNSAN